MFGTEKYKGHIRDLYAEIKRYLTLQKHLVAIDTAQVLITLLSVVAIATVCFVFGSMIVFFSMFALANWLSEVIGNQWAGFRIVAVIIVSMLFTFYRMRRKLIVTPLTRLIISLLVTRDKTSKGEEEEV